MTMAKFEKIKKRAAKKLREAEVKQDMRKKMSVIAASTINNDEELLLDKSTWDKLKQIDIEDAEKYMDTSSEDEEDEDKNYNMPGMSKHLSKLEAKDELEQKKERRRAAGQASESEHNSDDSDSSDNSAKRINRMADEIE